MTEPRRARPCRQERHRSPGYDRLALWDLGFHETVWGDELEAFSLEQGKEIGTLLFGRRTYEGMAGYWSQETGAIADMMNSIDKAVATRTLDEATWNNTRLLKGEAAEAVRALKAEEGKDVYVFGSADLLGSKPRHQVISGRPRSGGCLSAKKMRSARERGCRGRHS